MAGRTEDLIVYPIGRDAAVSTIGGLREGRPVDDTRVGPGNPGLQAWRLSSHEVADSNLYVHALTPGMSKPENFTVRMGEELKRRMKDHPEINWSHVIRAHVRSVLDDVDRMDRLASDSDLTEDDVEALSAVIEAAAAERARDDIASRDRGGGERGGGTEDQQSRRTGDVTDADAT